VIDPRYRRLVFAFFMALLMSCIMSLAITVSNIGLVPDILSRWMRAWALAFGIAFPAIFVISPLVDRLVRLALKPE
jgi:hypothetical protein